MSWVSMRTYTPDPPERCHLPLDRLMALSRSKGRVAFPSSSVTPWRDGGRAIASLVRQAHDPALGHELPSV